MPTISPLSLVRNEDVDLKAPEVDDIRRAVQSAVDAVVEAVDRWAASPDPVAFRDVEDELRELVFAFARAAIVLFLALREQVVTASYPAGERVEAWGGRVFRRAPAIGRNLTTMFGVVRYWRTYMREVAAGPRRGFHPLDVALGLPADRFSWNVLAKGVWLATKLSFAEARSTLLEFVPNAPSTEVIEKAALGLGHLAEDWLVNRGPPDDDGEVLVIMFDGKGIPTATEEELRRRRGPRRRRRPERSARHRGRRKRARHPKKPRRKKGDKSKNAKVATTVLMYTLRRRGSRLEGPINKWAYSSFAPKRHAFEVARRWANTRGFGDDSSKLIQVVTDGDNDLADLYAEYFPHAEHTIDVWHVVEYIWEAGACCFPEGSVALKKWVEEQEARLFEGRIAAILAEMKRRLNDIAKTGPGNKGRRERLLKAMHYIDKRRAKLDYGRLHARDMEISTGPIEGAIKNIIGKRQDHGGMRWIKERAEAVLKLRCIDVVGDWKAFERDAHNELHARALLMRERVRLQLEIPQELPCIAEAA